MPSEGRLYTDLAEYYDQIYHWKDYRKEVSKLRALIRRYKRSPGNALLDVACGTGEHIRYLQNGFRCVGVDGSEQMLAVARRKVAGVRFVHGNMTDFDLGRKFDVVLCLFSSMGHLQTKQEIRRAMLNFAKHLKEGGVLVIEPWIQASQWKDKTVHVQIYDTEPMKIIRLNYSTTDGTFSYLDERYLVGTKGKGIEYIEDRHSLRFFEPELTLSVLRKAGLDAQFTEESLMPERGLVIATRRR
jgi:ubiquinone/menaquinone biosynthesis C-methylase UbiE